MLFKFWFWLTLLSIRLFFLLLMERVRHHSLCTRYKLEDVSAIVFLCSLEQSWVGVFGADLMVVEKKSLREME